MHLPFERFNADPRDDSALPKVFSFVVWTFLAIQSSIVVLGLLLLLQDYLAPN